MHLAHLTAEVGGNRALKRRKTMLIPSTNGIGAYQSPSMYIGTREGSEPFQYRDRSNTVTKLLKMSTL